jgi:hypothetical protein
MSLTSPLSQLYIDGAHCLRLRRNVAEFAVATAFDLMGDSQMDLLLHKVR